jgi:hypothetical protein
MRNNYFNNKTRKVAEYDLVMGLWYVEGEESKPLNIYDLTSENGWSELNLQPPFYSDKHWESLADAYQSFYFTELPKKIQHPLQAFSDGLQHGVRIGMFFAHWIEQQGYGSFMAPNEQNKDQLEIKWVNKRGYPISPNDLFKEFCEYAKTVF